MFDILEYEFKSFSADAFSAIDWLSHCDVEIQELIKRSRYQTKGAHLDGKELWLAAEISPSNDLILKKLRKNTTVSNLEHPVKLQSFKSVANAFCFNEYQTYNLFLLYKKYKKNPNEETFNALVKYVDKECQGVNLDRSAEIQRKMIKTYRKSLANDPATSKNLEATLKCIENDFIWEYYVLNLIRNKIRVFNELLKCNFLTKNLCYITALIILKRAEMRQSDGMGCCYTMVMQNHAAGVELKKENGNYCLTILNLGLGCQAADNKNGSPVMYQFPDDKQGQKKLLSVLADIEYQANQKPCEDAKDGQKYWHDYYDKLAEKGSRIQDACNKRPVQTVGNCSIRNPMEISLHILQTKGYYKEATDYQNHFRSCALDQIEHSKLTRDLKDDLIKRSKQLPDVGQKREPKFKYQKFVNNSLIVQALLPDDYFNNPINSQSYSKFHDKIPKQKGDCQEICEDNIRYVLYRT
jgi:hypothetical protein